jgi:signal transduction histidine kinase
MDNSIKPSSKVEVEDLFAGGGEMGELMRSIDWSTTQVGPVSMWPPSMRLAIKICLTSRFPMLLWWGQELMDLIIQYNDAFRPVLGILKHPKAMGQRGYEVWPEIWPIIGPMLESVLTTGKATWSDNQLLFHLRNGYKEESYFTYSYSPIWDEYGNVRGIFTAVAETTKQVLGERRMKTLRDLGAKSSHAKTVEEACQNATLILGDNQTDIPFGLVYILSQDSKQATLNGVAGLNPDQSFGPPHLQLDETGTAGTNWPLARVISQCQSQLLTGFQGQLADITLSAIGQTFTPDSALIVPLLRPGEQHPTGFIVAGISPFRELDDTYRDFVERVAESIATSIANARAYEDERKRWEALEELDRAKMVFFSNISHEFRTPLTLLLGPLEDAMANITKDNPEQQYERLQIIQRNGLRLLKLVNNLLDFSRIEAGRVEAAYQPTNLATFTSELGSVFRAAVENAGLKYVVDCPPLDLHEPVYVDREMWEKIVLNLLSNAFKFTFEGQIALRLRTSTDCVELRVEDSGTGIPTRELPHLFERFYRLRGAKARTHEGSGIGLALIHELVKLHGGKLEVESVFGQGSVFKVLIPQGKSHLPVDRIEAQTTSVSTTLSEAAYIEEALRWLPQENTQDSARATHLPAPTTSPVEFESIPGLSKALAANRNSNDVRQGGYILLVDDNTDMRDYMRRLLTDQGYTVDAAQNGLEALELTRNRLPELVLSDVMMPEMDGFELLQELRKDPRTTRLPVILVSARAGEEAVIEGVRASADDYLVKPFSARELLARIQTHLKLARLREEVLQSEKAAFRKVKAIQARLTFLVEASIQLGASLNYEQTLQTLCDLSVSELADYCIIWLRRENEVQVAKLAGRTSWITSQLHHVLDFYTPDQNSLLKKVLDNGQSHFLPTVDSEIMLSIAGSPDQMSLLETLNVQSHLLVPLKRQEEVIGALSLVLVSGDRHFDLDDLTMAEELGRRAAMAIDNARLYREVQEALEQAEKVAALEERQRLARELHDSVTQSLFSLSLLAEAGRRQIHTATTDQLEGQLKRLRDIAHQSLKEMRLLVYELRQHELEQEGLAGAIKMRLNSVEKRAGIETKLVVEGESGALSSKLEENLYRIAMEALNNSLKHSNANVVIVKLRVGEKLVELEINDNGKGFDLAILKENGGLGITSMRERVAQLGGSFDLASVPRRGTAIKIRIDRPEQA